MRSPLVFTVFVVLLAGVIPARPVQARSLEECMELVCLREYGGEIPQCLTSPDQHPFGLPGFCVLVDLPGRTLPPDCQQYHGHAEPCSGTGGPGSLPVVLPPDACEAMPPSPGGDGGNSIDWAVVNQRAETVRVMWVDWNGDEALVDSIEPGQTIVVSTSNLHNFVIRTEQGECVGAATANEAGFTVPPAE